MVMTMIIASMPYQQYIFRDTGVYLKSWSGTIYDLENNSKK